MQINTYYQIWRMNRKMKVSETWDNIKHSYTGNESAKRSGQGEIEEKSICRNNDWQFPKLDFFKKHKKTLIKTCKKLNEAQVQ